MTCLHFVTDLMIKYVDHELILVQSILGAIDFEFFIFLLAV